MNKEATKGGAMKCHICGKEMVCVGYNKDASIIKYHCKDHGIMDLVEDPWMIYRREAAKDIYCSLIRAGLLKNLYHVELASAAIDLTDDLIRQLNQK